MTDKKKSGSEDKRGENELIHDVAHHGDTDKDLGLLNEEDAIEIGEDGGDDSSKDK